MKITSINGLKELVVNSLIFKQQTDKTFKSEEVNATSSLNPETGPSSVSAKLSPLDQIKKELSSNNPSIIKIVSCLVEAGQEMRASDIHLDPESESIKVRFRIDGVLRDLIELPKKLHEEVISRIKILASLRTDEHQAAHDGRFRLKFEKERDVDVRVSIIPTYYGENAILRLLSDRVEEFTLNGLGFSEKNQKKVLETIKKPFGMILLTGPTGSGKTTTLYALVKMLNSRDRSIITIEDPIEYSISGVNQVQVNARTELTFANGLRSILRQDPNIIMVGEIRDTETAGIAVNTALTGHLLLSTLHTNDAATTLPRLLDMKIESFLIASTVNIVVGQRLVRKICSYCKEERAITDAERKSLSEVLPRNLLDSYKSFYEGRGCERCGNSGYEGRIGIQEVLVIDGVIREAILRKAAADEIYRLAVKQGMTPMFEDGLEKVKNGVTTISEILATLHE